MRDADRRLYSLICWTSSITCSCWLQSQWCIKSQPIYTDVLGLSFCLWRFLLLIILYPTTSSFRSSRDTEERRQQSTVEWLTEDGVWTKHVMYVNQCEIFRTQNVPESPSVCFHECSIYQLSHQDKMLAVNGSANNWSVHICHIDISTKRVVSYPHYIFMTWHYIMELEGMMVELNVRIDAKPLTTVQGCVSTFVSVTPQDSFWQTSGQVPLMFVATKNRYFQWETRT